MKMKGNRETRYYATKSPALVFRNLAFFLSPGFVT